MPPHELVLEGCAPVPLAGYLKALGVLRIIASRANSVTGEAADPNARGWWKDERFYMRTRLDREALIHFFLNDYRPTPVVSPWNGGSGFYFREGKTNEKDPLTGKRVKTGIRNEATQATKILDNVLTSESNRFETYRITIETAKYELKSRNLQSAPGEREKSGLIRSLRSSIPDEALDWIDAATAVTQVEVEFPPLLGSGGNDGNLDF